MTSGFMMLPKLQRPDLQSEGRQRSRQLPGLPGGRRARASEQGWQVELAQSVIRVCHGPFRQHPRQCAGPRLSAVQTLPAPRGAGRKVRAQDPPRSVSTSDWTCGGLVQPPLCLEINRDNRTGQRQTPSSVHFAARRWATGGRGKTERAPLAFWQRRWGREERKMGRFTVNPSPRIFK